MAQILPLNPTPEVIQALTLALIAVAALSVAAFFEARKLRKRVLQYGEERGEYGPPLDKGLEDAMLLVTTGEGELVYSRNIDPGGGEALAAHVAEIGRMLESSALPVREVLLLGEGAGGVMLPLAERGVYVLAFKRGRPPAPEAVRRAVEELVGG